MEQPHAERPPHETLPAESMHRNNARLSEQATQGIDVLYRDCSDNGLQFMAGVRSPARQINGGDIPGRIALHCVRLQRLRIEPRRPRAMPRPAVTIKVPPQIASVRNGFRPSRLNAVEIS